MSGLPARPRSGDRYWLETDQPLCDYTHSLFRYPAKFHRPVVRWALANSAKKRQVVLDPFAGSGTLNVEALLAGRPSVGIDLDPLACFVATAKTTVLDPNCLDRALERIKRKARAIMRTELELERLIGSDISEDVYNRGREKFWIPNIPNITHWFKRHVILDLASLLHLLKEEVRLRDPERNFFLACFAAVIRRVSNADPTPVSGLEVTSVQAKRNETREINVVDEFLHKSRMAIHGMREVWAAVRVRKCPAATRIICGDAREIENVVVYNAPELLPFSLVVTSPPYCSAVEYGRRHKLEMYWLNLVDGQNTHAALSRSYIGHRNMAEGRSNCLREFGITPLDRLLQRIGDLSFKRAVALERYFASIEKFIYELARVTEMNADFVCVIGNSTCAGLEVRTASFIQELASEHFQLRSSFAYAIQNHHMQYGLRNGRGIREEVVLVFKRR